MINYKIEKDEEGDIKPCDSCRCEVQTYAFPGLPGNADNRLCELCSSTEGRPETTVCKGMLAQMFHAFRRSES